MNSKYLFAAVLPDNLQTELSKIREGFEENVSEKVPAHISLTFPFYFKENGSKILENVALKLKSTSVFLAKIKGITHYPRGDSKIVVVAKVQPEDKFINLNLTLNSCLGTEVEYDTEFFSGNKLPEYEPHLTLAINATLDDEKSIKTMFGNKSLNFVCSRIFLLKKIGEFWEKESVYNLG